MGKVESTIRSEILRLAKKEIRSIFIPLKRELRIMKLRVSDLKKNVAVLDRLNRERGRGEDGQEYNFQASPEEVKASRFTPQRIRMLRQRLGISQKELALLTKVTIGAVGSWEKGKFEPKTDKKGILLGLRKLKKRGVKRLLNGLREAGEGKSNRSRGKGSRKKRKGTPARRRPGRKR